MADIALFHSVLGVRPGIHDAAQRLRAAGHRVLVVDQYDGRVFDDYAEAGAYSEALGYPELVRRGLAAVEPLPDGFVAAGFSNGAAMAECVATQRVCSGALLFSGALPLGMLGAAAWPSGTPVQIHYALQDPFRRQEWVDGLAAEVSASGSRVEVFDYAGSGAPVHRRQPAGRVRRDGLCGALGTGGGVRPRRRGGLRPLLTSHGTGSLRGSHLSRPQARGLEMCSLRPLRGGQVAVTRSSGARHPRGDGGRRGWHRARTSG
ncbi:MAG: dienelactone hydrolase family protein [Quadrisphaera sp.]